MDLSKDERPRIGAGGGDYKTKHTQKDAFPSATGGQLFLQMKIAISIDYDGTMPWY